jgi:hypothetical protein
VLDGAHRELQPRRFIEDPQQKSGIESGHGEEITADSKSREQNRIRDGEKTSTEDATND